MNRLTMATISKDMDRWIEKRDMLSRKADDLRKQKEVLEKDSSVSCVNPMGPTGLFGPNLHVACNVYVSVLNDGGCYGLLQSFLVFYVHYVMYIIYIYIHTAF